MNKIFKLLMFLVLFSTNIFALEYNVDKKKDNLVKFISSAPIEDFEGVTNKIDGYILPPDEKNLYNSEVYFEVDLNSIDTGIGLRNRHMREDYLHTDKYPYTSFKGLINEVKKKSEKEFDIKASGDISIHGVTRKITVSGTITFVPNGINVTSNFSVKLSDFKIKVPEVMFLKISEEIKLILDFNMNKVK